MSYDDPATQRRIDVSVGINNAALLAAGQPDPLEYFGTIVADVVEKTIELQTEHAIQDAVVLAFPGTTVTTAVPAWVAEATAALDAPVQGYGPAPVSQPAAIPGATDGDPQVAAIWADFFANPKDYWDNRAKIADGSFKRGTPSFKHRKDGDKAVWVEDKKNPSWVHSNLVSRGLVPA